MPVRSIVMVLVVDVKRRVAFAVIVVVRALVMVDVRVGATEVVVEVYRVVVLTTVLGYELAVCRRGDS